jgi:hypothetical protein
MYWKQLSPSPKACPLESVVFGREVGKTDFFPQLELPQSQHPNSNWGIDRQIDFSHRNNLHEVA